MAKGKPGQMDTRAKAEQHKGEIVLGGQAGTPLRGSPVQGEKQHLKGGPAGAMQGGASRGGSRVEPSHTNRAAKKNRGK